MAQVVHAAGAVVWRVRRERLEVLLIHRPSYDDWSWPKGKPHKRETLPACAIREVKEETGVEVVLGVPLPNVKYRLANGKRKINSYWAAQPAASEEPVAARPEVEPAPLSEVDEAVWVEAVKALTMLTRRGDREPLKALLDLYADGALATWAVLLTRHGTAKKRSAWEGGELSRPLTPAGEKQARALVPLFAAFGAHRVLTSPWVRCESTVAPFAQAGGLRIETFSCLTEQGASEDPKATKKLIDSTLESPGNAIVCTHRPVLPIVLEAAKKRAPHRVQDHFPDADPHLRTGAVLVLHVAARPGKRPRIVASEMHRPRR